MLAEKGPFQEHIKMTTTFNRAAAIGAVLGMTGHDLASAQELTGAALVQALGARSFDGIADRKPMTIVLSAANQRRDIACSGACQWRSFTSKCKMSKTGFCRMNGSTRTFSATAPGGS
jgi:hypothetical protein